MNTKAKGLVLKSFGVFLLAGIFAYAIFHIGYTLGIEALDYARVYVTGLLDFLIPALAAAVLVYVYCECERTPPVLLAALLFAVARAAYYIPYYYIYYFEMGFDTPESLLLSLITSVTLILLSFILLFVVYLAGYITLRIHFARTGERIMLSDSRPMDFSSASTRAVFAIVLTRLVISYVTPIISAVQFLGEHGDTISYTELISMGIDLTLPLAYFLIAYFLTVHIKNKVVLRA